ncbi:hypothetical protein BDR06DRAFT_966354 [Suillus hirtellus]|nr:hypothetical protein BDR06DRAFT_966354 [Suillus hirtellus]
MFSFLILINACCDYPKGHPHFTKTPLPAASKHVVVQGTIQQIMGDHCIITVKNITLGPLDMVTATDDSSKGVPSTTLSQFNWGGACKEKEQGTLKGKAKEKGKKENGEESDVKNDGKRAHDNDDEKDRDKSPSMSAVLPCKATCVSK